MQRVWAVAWFALLMSCQAAAEPACGDFLLSLDRKPAHVEFVECKSGHEHQLRALFATYRVRGVHARDIELYFRRHAMMTRLRFVCCVWEPDARTGALLGRLPGRPTFFYEVAMVAEETRVARRSHWHLIPWFHVTVILFLEEP